MISDERASARPAPFRARRPWWGPDLQTLRNTLRGPVGRIRAADERTLVLPLADGTGDALVGELATPHRSAGSRPIVVLIHGLSGSSDSAYMHTSASHWLALGHPVLRLNLRGAGPSRAHCTLQYHAGRSEDLRDALLALQQSEPTLSANGVVLVGYSLGGNMLLKYLGECGPSPFVRAAASVSAPIDLSAASQRFLEPRNRFYHRHLLATMKRESFGGKSVITEAEARSVERARSIYEFDERFVAPRNGYRDAEHYYAETHARRYLPEIRVPTCIVYALDDPWIPAESYTDYRWSENLCLEPHLAPGGGHVGFHDADGRVPWHDRCIAAFVAEHA